MHVVANVLPFRVNQYVIDELIEWGNIPEDPVFQLTFPQRGMLDEESFYRMSSLFSEEPDAREIRALAWEASPRP